MKYRTNNSVFSSRFEQRTRAVFSGEVIPRAEQVHRERIEQRSGDHQQYLEDQRKQSNKDNP